MKMRFVGLLWVVAMVFAGASYGKESISPSIPSALNSSMVDPLPDMIERVSPGVVNISSSTTLVDYQIVGMDDFLRLWGFPRERKQTFLGSGFIIDKNGYVVTNHHVIQNATEVLVTLLDKRSFHAKIVGKDDKMDLALLQIRDDHKHVPAELKPVAFGDSDKIRIGETVIAEGNPFGLHHTVTRGIISAKNRSIGLGPFDNFLQTDASVNPGNSGGPLFNMKGEVIGINTAIRSETGQSGGLNFAIPSNEAKQLIPDLVKYGRIPRPWLGIWAERVTPQLAFQYRLPVTKGVLIYQIVEDAPAFRAGMDQGDIIVYIGPLTGSGDTESGKVQDLYDVERLLNQYKPNSVVPIHFQRGKKKMEIRVKLDELPRLEKLPKGIL